MQCEFSYPVLKAILSKVPFQIRIYLSRYSRSIKTIHKTIDIVFSRIRFYNKVEMSRQCSFDRLPHPSAVLSVDNVVYQFLYDEKTKLVEIKCSLAPNQSKFTDDMRSARKYFHYFIQFPFDFLDLEECCYPFGDEGEQVKPNCRSLRWDCKGKMIASRFQTESLSNCNFDRVELYNLGDTAWFSTDDYVLQAKHVVINSDFSNRSKPSLEARDCLFFFARHQNQLIQFTLNIHCVLTFIHCCTFLIGSSLEIGSFYKTVFVKRNGLKQKMIEQICNYFPNVDMVSDECGQLLAILESNDEYRVEVKWEANDDHETFIAIKEKAILFDI